MRKSLRHSGMGVGEMALYLGVQRNTVSTWINGHITPSRQTLMLWAEKTETTVRWLETGEGSPGTPGDGKPVKRDALAQLAAKKRSRHAVDGTNHRYAAA